MRDGLIAKSAVGMMVGAALAMYGLTGFDLGKAQASNIKPAPPCAMTELSDRTAEEKATLETRPAPAVAKSTNPSVGFSGQRNPFPARTIQLDSRGRTPRRPVPRAVSAAYIKSRLAA